MRIEWDFEQDEVSGKVNLIVHERQNHDFRKVYEIDDVLLSDTAPWITTLLNEDLTPAAFDSVAKSMGEAREHLRELSKSEYQVDRGIEPVCVLQMRLDGGELMVSISVLPTASAQNEVLHIYTAYFDKESGALLDSFEVLDILSR